MKEQKIIKATLLQSKAKIMADRNARFAVVNEEMTTIKTEVMTKLGQLSSKIKSHLDNDD